MAFRYDNQVVYIKADSTMQDGDELHFVIPANSVIILAMESGRFQRRQSVPKSAARFITLKELNQFIDKANIIRESTSFSVTYLIGTLLLCELITILPFLTLAHSSDDAIAFGIFGVFAGLLGWMLVFLLLKIPFLLADYAAKISSLVNEQNKSVFFAKGCRWQVSEIQRRTCALFLIPRNRAHMTTNPMFANDDEDDDIPA